MRREKMVHLGKLIRRLPVRKASLRVSLLLHEVIACASSRCVAQFVLVGRIRRRLGGS